jgi:hypothetical protein
MTFPPPNPQTINTAAPLAPIINEREWAEHITPSITANLNDDRALAFRLLYRYGNRLRYFAENDQTWFCDPVTNLWAPTAKAATMLADLLVEDLTREIAYLEATTQNQQQMIDEVIAARNRLSAKVNNRVSVGNAALLLQDPQLARRGFQALSTKPSDFFKDEPGDEITARAGRIHMTPDGPVLLRAALPQDGFTKSLPWKAEDLLDGNEPEMYLRGIEHFMRDEYAREFFYLRLGTNVLGKKFKSGVLIFLYGTGRNGKTAAIRAPMLALGTDNSGYSKPMLTTDFFITDPRRPHNTDHNTFAYGLDGKRAASHGMEIKKNAQLYEENLKNAIFFQPMDQRKMRENERTELDLQASFYMAANHLPSVEIADRSIKRRFLCIEMTASAEEFGDTAFTEMQGDIATAILDQDGHRLAGFQIRKACEYLQQTQGNKRLHIPTSIRTSSEQWLSKLDPIAEFYQHYMRPDDNNEVNTAQIYAAYLAFHNIELAHDGFTMPMSSKDVIDHIDRARFPATSRKHAASADGRKVQHYKARLLSPSDADACQPYAEPYEADFEARLDLLLEEQGIVEEYDSAQYWLIHDRARISWPQSYFEQQYAQEVDSPTPA